MLENLRCIRRAGAPTPPKYWAQTSSMRRRRASSFNPWCSCGIRSHGSWMAIAPSNAGVSHSPSDTNISNSPTKDKCQVDDMNVVTYDTAVVLCSIASLANRRF